MIDPGLLHDLVGREARLNVAVDGKPAIRLRAIPDFVIAATLTFESAAVLGENALHVAGEGRHR